MYYIILGYLLIGALYTWVLYVLGGRKELNKMMDDEDLDEGQRCTVLVITFLVCMIIWPYMLIKSTIDK